MNAYWIKTGDIRVAIIPRPRGGDWLANDIEALKSSGVEKIVSLLIPDEIEELSLSEEEKICGGSTRLAGARYGCSARLDQTVSTKGNEFLIQFELSCFLSVG